MYALMSTFAPCDLKQQANDQIKRQTANLHPETEPRTKNQKPRTIAQLYIPVVGGQALGNHYDQLMGCFGLAQTLPQHQRARDIAGIRYQGDIGVLACRSCTPQQERYL